MEEYCGTEELFVWSSTGTDTETEDVEWRSHKESTETDSSEDDETEEDLADEDLEKEIRWKLFQLYDNNLNFQETALLHFPFSSHT